VDTENRGGFDEIMSKTGKTMFLPNTIAEQRRREFVPQHGEIV
jgi:hypothetical protein